MKITWANNQLYFCDFKLIALILKNDLDTVQIHRHAKMMFLFCILLDMSPVCTFCDIITLSVHINKPWELQSFQLCRLPCGNPHQNHLSSMISRIDVSMLYPKSKTFKIYVIISCYHYHFLSRNVNFWAQHFSETIPGSFLFIKLLYCWTPRFQNSSSAWGFPSVGKSVVTHGQQTTYSQIKVTVWADRQNITYSQVWEVTSKDLV